MIERNVDLTSRDVARIAPDGLTLSDAQRPERTRAEPPIWRSFQSAGVTEHRAHIRAICVGTPLAIQLDGPAVS